MNISGIELSNFNSTGIQVEGNLALDDSTVDGGFVGVWVNGEQVRSTASSVVQNAPIFGVQVSAHDGRRRRRDD